MALSLSELSAVDANASERPRAKWPEVGDPLVEAVRALAARDQDHASEQNGAGFNQADTGFGNRFAQIAPSDWSAANRRAAWECIRKYRAQLASYGIDYDSIPEPAKVEQVAAKRVEPFTLDFQNGLLVMCGPYDPKLVEAQRSIPGRRWSGERKANTFPRTSAVQVRGLMDMFHDVDWKITPLAKAVLDGKQIGTTDPGPQGESAQAKVRVSWNDSAHTMVSVGFDYNPVMVAAVKRLPGRSWDSVDRVWEVKLSEKGAYKLVKFLSNNRPVWCEDGVRERILELAKEGVERDKIRALMTKLSKAEDADIEIEGLGGTLKPFQRAGVDYVLKAGLRAFISDEQGLGKTPQALATLLAADKFPAVVLCPAVVKLSWRDHVQGPVRGAPEGWLPGRKVAVCDGMNGQPSGVWGADVIVANFDILAGWREVIEETVSPRALIVDESHYCKSPGALRTKETIALAEYVRANDGLVLNLSGTPVLNKPVELCTQLEMLGRLDEFGGRAAIMRRRSGEKINDELRASCFCRRLKKDVLKELPAKQIAHVPVELSNLAEYQQVERDVIHWLVEQVEKDKAFNDEIASLPEDERKERLAERKSDKAERAARAEHLVRINALRKVCAKGKLRDAKKWVTNFLDSGDEKLIVFASHVEVQRAMLDTFPGAAHVLGADSSEVRNAEVKRFQADDTCRLIVCSTEAASVGITLTAASNVAFLELEWTPAKHDQAEDRAHRISQEGNVVCWYLLAENTIDGDMSALLEAKRLVVSATTDGVASNREGSILGELEARLLARA
jgi:hypothetical protein